MSVEFGHHNDDAKRDRQEQLERFARIARGYERAYHIEDSKVRLVQEQAIANDLQQHVPVLIRGHWRTGKTSTIRSLGTHVFGKNMLCEDISPMMASKPPDEFARNFAYPVAEFLKKQGEKDVDHKALEESSMMPLDALDQYCGAKGVSAVLALDEVVAFDEQPDILQYIADLKRFKNISVALVLHRIGRMEDTFKKVFNGYTTYFMEPLSAPEADLLIEGPLRDTNPKIIFTPEAKKEICALSGNRPWEIHNVCHASIEPPWSGEWVPRLTYTLEDIQALMQNPRASDHPLNTILHNYDKIYNIAFTLQERRLVDKMSKQPEGLASILVKRDLVHPLIELGIIRMNSEAGTYEINGELMRKVFAKEV